MEAGCHQLFRASNPVPIAAHRLEGIVGRYGVVHFILNLLENRIRLTVGKRVRRQEQQRNFVDSCIAGCRDQI